MELLGVINDGIGTVVHFIIIDGFNENLSYTGVIH
jgi:hypothetical protein